MCRPLDWADWADRWIEAEIANSTSTCSGAYHDRYGMLELLMQPALKEFLARRMTSAS